MYIHMYTVNWYTSESELILYCCCVVKRYLSHSLPLILYLLLLSFLSPPLLFLTYLSPCYVSPPPSPLHSLSHPSFSSSITFPLQGHAHTTRTAVMEATVLAILLTASVIMTVTLEVTAAEMSVISARSVSISVA